MPDRSPRVVLGLNQYTHSAACCLLDERGEVLFALAKERVSRKKFDGGDVSELVRYALEATGIGLDQVERVVANNHLFRIRPYEETLDFTVALNAARPSALNPHNLLPGVPKHELSHHLAHAWSVLPVAPFDEGLIVVMDGIGNTRRDVHTPDRGYTSDPDLPAAEGFREAPATPDESLSWREAESVYAFRGLELRRLFKRWTPERTPVFLYNYGFQDMESLGAVYSRVSSHVFGDWNACGKVMGLAPWDAAWNGDRPPASDEWILRGGLADLDIHWELLRGEPHANEWAEEERRPRYARLAQLVQSGLEGVVLEFLRDMRGRTGATRVCLAGGVALNSTLNGRIAREAGFEEVFVPSYPGDEGVAVGSAFFGHHALGRRTRAPRRSPLPPFLGRVFPAAEIDAALADVADSVSWSAPADLLQEVAAALAAEEVVGWFQGRSEFGPRALGNRSLLAHPGPAWMIERINAGIKKRESFRPFAPTVLAEKADEWFEEVTASPFMSLTVRARPERRDRIRAVVHVDGSARLQTLTREQNPRYYELIERFEDITGLPMVLNTSFNVAGEPIVESPGDALRTFLEAEIDLLVLEDRLVRKRPFPDAAALEELRPQHDSAVLAELLSDATGETQRVTLSAGGFLRETDELTLGVLEACTGDSTVPELVDAFRAEYEVPADEVLERLRRLHRWRLLRWLPRP